MAIAYQSKTDPTYEGNGAGENITITHPSGLAAGDLMIACLAEVDADTGVTPAQPSATGWTVIKTQTQASPGPARMTALYKVTSAGDVSAGNTTFTLGITGSDDVWVGGSIYRIDGQGDVSSIQSAINTSTGTSPSFDVTITPTFADSLLLFYVAQFPNSTGSFSSYAIATDNPTWTERFDSYGDAGGYGGSDDIIFAGATAPRSAITATGNASVSATVDSPSIGLLVVIPPVTGASISPSVITSALSVQAPTVTGGATVSPSVVTSTIAVQAPTVTLSTNPVSNTDKSSTTWVNETKS